MKKEIKSKQGDKKMKKLAFLGVVVLAVSLISYNRAECVTFATDEELVIDQSFDITTAVNEFEEYMQGFIGQEGVVESDVRPQASIIEDVIRDELPIEMKKEILRSFFYEKVEELGVMRGSREVLHGVKLSEIPDSSSSVLSFLEQLKEQSPLISLFIKDVEAGKASMSKPKINLEGDVLSVTMRLTPGGAWLLPSPAYDDGFFRIKIDKAIGDAFVVYRPVTPNRRNSSILLQRVKSLDK